MVASTGRRIVALLLGAAALCTPALASAQEAQTQSGFALEGSLGARFGIIASGNGETFGGTALQTELMGGYKFGRLLLGLGLEFSSGSTEHTTGATGRTQETITDSSFLIGPDFQAALVRTADGRVELIGDLSLHFGHASETTSSSPAPKNPPASPPTDSNFLLSYAIAPGLRYWLHPHLAAQVVTGFGGQAYFDMPINNNVANGNNSQHGIFTSFGLLGVF